MEVSDARRLKALEAENAKLKKMLAEQMLDVATLKEMLGSSQWRNNGSMSDTLSDGRRFRILCVIDEFSRECLATVVDTSLSGIRVARELDRIAELRGHPCTVVSDRRGSGNDPGDRFPEEGDRADLERHPWLAGRAPR